MKNGLYQSIVQQNHVIKIHCVDVSCPIGSSEMLPGRQGQCRYHMTGRDWRSVGHICPGLICIKLLEWQASGLQRESRYQYLKEVHKPGEGGAHQRIHLAPRRRPCAYRRPFTFLCHRIDGIAVCFLVDQKVLSQNKSAHLASSRWYQAKYCSTRTATTRIKQIHKYPPCYALFFAISVYIALVLRLLHYPRRIIYTVILLLRKQAPRETAFVRHMNC